MSLFPQTSSCEFGASSEGKYWLSSAEFAALAGISGQAARVALLRATRGHTWNGTALVVRKQGRAYQVDARSLPEHLYRKFYEANREAFSPAQVLPRESDFHGDVSGASPRLLSKHYRIAEWLAGIIAPALLHMPRSHARGEVLRSLAEQAYIRPTDGKPIRYAESKLRQFCRRFEEGGVHALMRKERKVEEKARSFVNRRWDKACPLPATIKAKLADGIEEYVRGVWAAGAPSRDKVRQLASAELAERCRAAGWDDANIKNCDVGQYLVESNQAARKVAIYQRDAKRFSDNFKPRIMRDRTGLQPMDCIVGDVHPVDIYLKREDGSTYTPRMIAWYDLATNRCYFTLLHPEQGQSVTQADVTRSFVLMCREWGIPRRLYLDNGPEYSWSAMVDGFKTLAAMGTELDLHLNEIQALEQQWVAEDTGTGEEALARDGTARPDDERVLVRAKPYNAAAKPIEGAFSAKEKVLSMLPGYVGGDRMNKRVSKVGRAPDTYPGSAEAFDRDFADAMAFFHATPQRGHLKGLSPAEAFGLAAPRAQATCAELVVFILAFSEEKSLKVRTSGVQIGSKDGGTWYFGDELVPLIGSKCLFRIAKWHPQSILLVQGTGAQMRYVAIHERPVSPFFDQDGAKEASRLEGLAKRHIRELKAGLPKIDLQDAMRKYVDESRKCQPTIPLVSARPERQIRLSDDLQALNDQLTKPNPNSVERVAPGEFIDNDGEVHRLPTRKEILDKKSMESTTLPDFRGFRPPPKQKPILDLEEYGRQKRAEVQEKKEKSGRLETTRLD